MTDVMHIAGADQGFPVDGRGPIWGCGPTTGHFLVKMYMKTKELGPVGGGHAPDNFVCRSANT